MLAAALAEVLPVKNPIVFVGDQSAHDVHPLGARHEHEQLRRIVDGSTVIHVHVRRAVEPASRGSIGLAAQHQLSSRVSPAVRSTSARAGSYSKPFVASITNLPGGAST